MLRSRPIQRQTPPNPPNYGDRLRPPQTGRDQDTVDHVDGNPSCNGLENLRWASRSEQVKYSYATNENRESNATRLSKSVEGRVLGAEAWVPYASSMEAMLQWAM